MTRCGRCGVEIDPEEDHVCGKVLDNMVGLGEQTLGKPIPLDGQQELL